MELLKDLVQNVLVEKTELAREGSGFAAWVMWKGELSSSIEQAFQDYGGTVVVRQNQSGLWFFFSVEAFMAFARVQLWAKMHMLDLSIVVMPAHIFIGERNNRGLGLDAELLTQSSPELDGFSIWVHPEIAEMGKGIPGLVFESAKETPVLVPLDWQSVYADTRLSYRTSFGWYCVLRPLGNPLEKRFQVGWRDFFGELENILQRQKFKYTLNNNFLLFPLDTLSQFRTWVREYFNLVKRLKDEENENYWPCVQVVVDKKGLIFNNDLPTKISLDWDQLMPDYPHMTFRNAYLLGDDFLMHDVRFETAKYTLSDWCNVSIKQEGAETSGFLPVVIPARLVSGKQAHCFYCGLRNHLPAHCPTKVLGTLHNNVWAEIAKMDFAAMNSALREVDGIVENMGDEGIAALLAEGDAPANILTKAIFSINSLAQYRMMPRIWLSRSKTCPKTSDKDIGVKDEHPIWQFLEKMPYGELIPLEKELQSIMQLHPRDYRLTCLNGFLALEREDTIRAASLWKEAEFMASTNVQQAYLQFLQARLLEIEGKYEYAGAAYGGIYATCPDWMDPRYRQVVCLVKMGFAEQAVSNLLTLAASDPNLFNRVLLDPEVERGPIQLQTSLYLPWSDAEAQIPGELATLQEMRQELSVWFFDDHPFALRMKQKIDNALALGGIANYVPYQRIIHSRAVLQKEMQSEITLETRNLRNRFKMFKQRLKQVQEEAAWFPFPRLLSQFTKVFNSVAQSTSWALKANLHVADTFNKAQRIADTEEDRIKKLEGQIKFLKIVRDSTLFVLLMGKVLIWVELAVLIVVFAGLPLLLYYSEKTSWGLASKLVFQEKWQLQKGLVVIFSLLALAIAALRTANVFERKRNALLQKGKEKIAEFQKK